MQATDAYKEIVQSLPQKLPLRIALRSSNVVNDTLIAKYTFECTPGLYPRESFDSERQDILSRSMLNITYVFQAVPPMDAAQLSTFQYALPLFASGCTFVLGTGLYLWMNARILNTNPIVKRSMLMVVGTLLLNVLYAVTSTLELSVVSCYALHVLSSLILSIVSR
jgi:hypothetical protein